MKKLLTIFLLVMVTFLFAETRESTDPYQYMQSARSIAMGRTAVASSQDSFGVFANPASFAKTEKFQMGIATFSLFDEYHYLGLSSVFETDYGKFSLSYVSMGMGDIPETEVYQNGSDIRIYQVDSYDVGDQVMGLGYIISSGEDFAMFRDLDLGVNAKLANSYVGDEVLTGFGFDVGARFSLGGIFTGYRFGFAMQNILGPTFSAGGDGETSDSAYGMNMRMGLSRLFSFKIPFTKVHVNNFLAAFDYDNNGLHFGGEYMIDKSFAVRIGLDDFKLTMGMGFKAFTFTGFDYKPYTVSLDYAYHLYDEPLENMHFFSFSVLGVTQTETPTIELPETGITVTSDLVTLQGTAQANSEIVIYVNDRMRKIAKANKANVWKAERVYLDQGKNNIYVTAQYEQYVLSAKSNTIVVFSDNVKPEITTDVYRDGSLVKLSVEANKEVKAVAVKLPNGKKLLLDFDTDTGMWAGNWTIPSEMVDAYLNIKTMAIDTNGTKSEVV